MASAAAAHYGLAPSFAVFGDLRKVWVKERLERERISNTIKRIHALMSTLMYCQKYPLHLPIFPI
jgi:hypothetical protein